MNHVNDFPFERNRYFYGKLLTVRDFEVEQRYHCSKRALLNRLLHGSGVVCGLGVYNLDDLSIMVDSGVGIDGLGREIVLDGSVVKKLSAIEGQLGASGTGVAGILAALSLPLLDWGAQVTATEQQLAALDQARANYTKTLLAALEQTENAITGITTSQSRADALQRALTAAESAADLAMQQYSAGLTDYQTVLNTQRTLYSVRENEQSNKADLATQLIALYRAMGGGWKPAVATKAADTTPRATDNETAG